MNNSRGDATSIIALKYFSLGRCVIPSGGGPDGKAALVPWKSYQKIKPTEEAIRKWERELKPAVWAMPTGPVSGCFVIDADTPESVSRMEAVGLHPHVKTRKGAHYYCRLPSWVVSNSTRIVPGFDIRGQGGYVNFCGGNGNAHYEVLMLPSEDSLYRIEQLPEDLQKALRPKPTALAERVLQQAIDQAHEGNRNDTGLWLACQLRDNGLSDIEAESFLQRYAARVKNVGAEPYDEAEAIASLHQAFTKPAREPWHKIPTVKEFKHFNLTDLGNAERLVSQYGDIIHYCYERRRWLVWNGKVWEWDSGNKVTTLAKHTVRNIYREAGDESEEKKRKEIAGHARNSESDHRINAIISLAESEPGIPVKITELDTDPWLLNCVNGTINLKTGQLQPHRKEDLLTILVPVEYHPSAQCPRWMSFLSQVTGGNDELMDYLKRAVGYSLTGDTKNQVLFFLYGLGNNGKSTFTMTIRKLLDGYGERMDADDLMLKDRNSGHGPKESIANLKGKRYVVGSEIQDGRKLDVSLLKDMTGGETIKARRLYEHDVEFAPTHKLWLFGNHKPVITDTTLSIWRRVKLLPFTVTIPSEKVDPDLALKLEAELPGILTWAVNGCLEWQRHGLNEPKVVTSATSDYRHEEDILGDFIEDCCLLKPTSTVPKHELKDAYETWCNSTGSQPTSQKVFKARLIERGVSEGKSGGTRYWRGIALLDAEGQQGQLGQEGQPGQELPEKSYTKEKQKDFTANTVPPCPDVPTQDMPEYPNRPCSGCGSTDFWLTDWNEWLCSRCHPDPAREQGQ
ncbi:DNA primase/helicase, phage-associated [Dehalococcoides mccartyi]|uniref:phage/plasmid primase, P4 family n=1 Tax=Dehalococcoides mccartyi TaxID=61435 RepID=UPI000D4871D9|nr:phage/plasmid primase, P4 family [Dehalococcoides mccartyi]POZ58448.1 DNA primase/helicase, phage-associated [Dehalococcoides mccartyi]